MKTNSNFIASRFYIRAIQGKTKIIFLFLMIPTLLFAQYQSKLWLLGDNEIQFPSLNVFFPNGPPTIPEDPTNVMQDIPGNNNLFIVSSSNVTDYRGFPFSGGAIHYDPNSEVKGITEWAIVPDPGDCNSYYLIGGTYTNPSTSINPNTNGGSPELYYIKINLSLTSIYGAIGDFENHDNIAHHIQTNHFAYHNGSLHLAVTPLREDIVNPTNNNRFLFFSDCVFISRAIISSAGISPTVDVAALPNGNNSGIARNEMEVVRLLSGNYRIAVGYETSGNGGASSLYKIYVADLDYTTGDLIANTEKIIDLPFTSGGPIAVPKGLEFSADGKYLFVSHTQSPYLEYAYVNTTGPISFTSLKGVIHNGADMPNPEIYQFGQIEMGYDGRLYFAATDHLASLDIGSNIGSPRGSPVDKIWLNQAIPNLILPVSQSHLNHSAPDASNLLDIIILNDQIDGEVYQDPTNNSANPQCCSSNTSFDISMLDGYNVNNNVSIRPTTC